MIRNILSVLSGYVIFVITSLALFKLAGQDPHADPTTTFIMLTVIYGAAFSFLSGLITQLISTFSLLKTIGNHWTQLLAIFIFAPISILGGLFYNKRNNK